MSVRGKVEKVEPFSREFESGLVLPASQRGRRHTRKHTHYFKNVEPYGEIDVYRVLSLFEVTDPALQHAIKKLLVAGGRGAGKDISQDVQEAIDTLERWKEMRAEDGQTGEI